MHGADRLSLAEGEPAALAFLRLQGVESCVLIGGDTLRQRALAPQRDVFICRINAPPHVFDGTVVTGEHAGKTFRARYCFSLAGNTRPADGALGVLIEAVGRLPQRLSDADLTHVRTYPATDEGLDTAREDAALSGCTGLYAHRKDHRDLFFDLAFDPPGDMGSFATDGCSSSSRLLLVAPTSDPDALDVLDENFTAIGQASALQAPIAATRSLRDSGGAPIQWRCRRSSHDPCLWELCD
jgi:hypothetical protein